MSVADKFLSKVVISCKARITYNASLGSTSRWCNRAPPPPPPPPSPQNCVHWKQLETDTTYVSLQAQKMLADHVMFSMKSRKTEQKREALLARLNIDSDQLLCECSSSLSFRMSLLFCLFVCLFVCLFRMLCGA